MAADHSGYCTSPSEDSSHPGNIKKRKRVGSVDSVDSECLESTGTVDEGKVRAMLDLYNSSQQAKKVGLYIMLLLYYSLTSALYVSVSKIVVVYGLRRLF